MQSYRKCCAPPQFACEMKMICIAACLSFHIDCYTFWVKILRLDYDLTPAGV